MIQQYIQNIHKLHITSWLSSSIAGNWSGVWDRISVPSSWRDWSASARSPLYSSDVGSSEWCYKCQYTFSDNETLISGKHLNKIDKNSKTYRQKS